MNNGNSRRVLQIVAAIVGTVIVSVASAFFAFGQQQQSSIVRLEASENEDARQRQIDQATIAAVNAANKALVSAVARLESRVAVLEAKVEILESASFEFVP